MKYLVYCRCIARGASLFETIHIYMHKPLHVTYLCLLHFCLFVVWAIEAQLRNGHSKPQLPPTQPLNAPVPSLTF